MFDQHFLAARASAARLGLDPPTDPADDVALVPWPTDGAARTSLVRAGIPVLLVLAPGTPPPDEWDDLEDWVRAPLDPDEVAHRQRALRDRLEQRSGGLTIDDGLMRRGSRWVSLTPTQLAVTRALLGQVGRVVRRDDLVAVFEAAGGHPTRDAFASCLKRLRERLRALDITLHGLSDGRLMLEVDAVRTAETQPASARIRVHRRAVRLKHAGNNSARF